MELFDRRAFLSAGSLGLFGCRLGVTYCASVLRRRRLLGGRSLSSMSY